MSQNNFMNKEDIRGSLGLVVDFVEDVGTYCVVQRGLCLGKQMRTSGFSPSLLSQDVFSSLNSGGALELFLFKFNLIPAVVMCSRSISGKFNNSGASGVEMSGRVRTSAGDADDGREPFRVHTGEGGGDGDRTRV